MKASSLIIKIDAFSTNCLFLIKFADFTNQDVPKFKPIAVPLKAEIESAEFGSGPHLHSLQQSQCHLSRSYRHLLSQSHPKGPPIVQRAPQ